MNIATSVINTLESFAVIPTGAALGAQICGVDFARPLPQTVAQALLDAWHEHLVLLIRNQSLTSEQYVQAARVFGKPQPGALRQYFEKTGQPNPSDALGIPEITILSNLDADGNPAQKNEGLGSEEVVWHSDNSYIQEPPAGSTLYAREIPADGSGRTSFNNQYLAFDQLPDDLRAAIKTRRSKQDATRNSAGVLRPGLTLPACPEEVPGPMHPLVRKHPVTYKNALFLGRRRQWPSQYIEGYTNDESEALLDRLWAHATQEQYAWTHNWRIGDMLVWDNRCTMHYREPVNSAARRVMWRSQFQGETIIAA